MTATQLTAAERILVALDFPGEVPALAFWDKIKHTGVGYKVGKQICVAVGPPRLSDVLGGNGLLDLKFHDIPNTVEGAVEAAARLGYRMVNVHCQGGTKMMMAARRAADKVFVATGKRPFILGVTVLTSLDGPALQEIGYTDKMTPSELVFKLAGLALKSGLDGVICSPQEIKLVRHATACDSGFLIVTPGIRNPDAPLDDQKRTATIAEAASWGADYFVIGRPITQAADPLAATLGCIEQVEQALALRA